MWREEGPRERMWVKVEGEKLEGVGDKERGGEVDERELRGCWRERERQAGWRERKGGRDGGVLDNERGGTVGEKGKWGGVARGSRGDNGRDRRLEWEEGRERVEREARRAGWSERVSQREG